MTPFLPNLKAAYFTLGCKLNFAETSTISKILSQKGIQKALPGEIPDLCIVNTCSVTEMADKKARNLIRKISGRYPDATIIVTGCYAQLKPSEVAKLPGVEIVLGSNEKLRIAEFIENWIVDRQPTVQVTAPLDIKEFRPSCEKGDRTRYFLKIQDGCDYFCTYCTIPFARGRSRSGRIDDLVALAEDVARQDGREIVITGVNIGEFGKDNGQDFLTLLKRLDAIENICRYRISSIEPNLITEKIVRWIAEESSSFMPHFHIPLQSGSDLVLKLMNRRYDTSLFSERINMIRQLLPDAFIGVDVITGARGETQEEWLKGKEFIESLDISRLHVFPYSERPGTKALSLASPVSQEEKHRRAAILGEISEQKHYKFLKKNLSSMHTVLWERAEEDSFMNGLTDNYIRVKAPIDKSLINHISVVKLDSIDADESGAVIASHVELPF